MSADPADLIFYGRMTPERFFAEAERLGIAEEELHDQPTYDRVLAESLIAVRAETAQGVAADLGVPIGDGQARNIARNSLVPDVLPGPAPLTPEERAVATELYYRAVRAAAARNASRVAERAARAAAQRMVRDGERGLTRLHQLARNAGCLVVLGVLGSLSGLTAAAAAMAAVALR